MICEELGSAVALAILAPFCRRSHLTMMHSRWSRPGCATIDPDEED